MPIDKIKGGGGLHINGDPIGLVMTYDLQDSGFTVDECTGADDTNLVKGQEYFGPEITWGHDGDSARVKIGAGSAQVEIDYIVVDPDPDNPISVIKHELGVYTLSCANIPTETKVDFQIWLTGLNLAKVILLPRPKGGPTRYVRPKVQGQQLPEARLSAAPPEAPPRREDRTS